MTVWAVNIDKHDASPAAVWGDIRHISTRYVYGDEIEDQQLPMAVSGAIRNAVHEFNPRSDFVLIYGDHLQLVHFMRLLGSYWQMPIHILRWDKKAGGYIPVWV